MDSRNTFKYFSKFVLLMTKKELYQEESKIGSEEAEDIFTILAGSILSPFTGFHVLFGSEIAPSSQAPANMAGGMPDHFTVPPSLGDGCYHPRGKSSKTMNRYGVTLLPEPFKFNWTFH